MEPNDATKPNVDLLLDTLLKQGLDGMHPTAFSSKKLALHLDAVSHLRAAKLKEREALNLPLVVVRDGEPMPDGIDGEILRLGLLVDRLQAEYVRRQVAQNQATGDALPTEFDGDPKL